jgi:YggT family protein
VAIGWQVVYIALWVFFGLLLVRFVFDWVQALSRDWRPHGPVLVVLETCYSVTDPPLRALRSVVPPIRLGNFSADIAWIALFLAVWILIGVVASL